MKQKTRETKKADMSDKEEEKKKKAKNRTAKTLTVTVLARVKKFVKKKSMSSRYVSFSYLFHFFSLVGFFSFFVFCFRFFVLTSALFLLHAVHLLFFLLVFSPLLFISAALQFRVFLVCFWLVKNQRHLRVRYHAVVKLWKHCQERSCLMTVNSKKSVEAVLFSRLMFCFLAW